MTPIVTIERGVLVCVLVGAVLTGWVTAGILAVLIARGVARRREREAEARRGTWHPPALTAAEQRLLGARVQWQTLPGVTGLRSWN